MSRGFPARLIAGVALLLAMGNPLAHAADAAMIDVIQAQAAAPDMGAYRVVRRIDHGPERPEWYVA